jgi:hypothetical protein
MNTATTEKPEGLTEDHLYYLDLLRETGATNMFGARPYLMEEFDIDGDTAAKILTYWMRIFSERHSEK